MNKNRSNKEKIWISVILAMVILLFMYAGYGENYTWNCPECGRIGNKGNFCGTCAHPAPWKESATPEPIIGPTVSTSVTTTLEPLRVQTIDINNSTFPDKAFKTFVTEFDQDGNKKLDEEELSVVTYMDCHQQKIKSLQGIEYFYALQELNCSNNNLSELDLFSNTALIYADCSRNKLTSIDIRNNEKLQYLNLFDNQLSELDLSKNTELTEVRISKNQIHDLDLSHNNKLEILFCNDNLLEALNTEETPFLKALECAGNQIKEIDLNNNMQLERLRCYGNELTSIEITNCEHLIVAATNGDQREDKNGRLWLFLNQKKENGTDTDLMRNAGYFGLHVDKEMRFSTGNSKSFLIKAGKEFQIEGDVLVKYKGKGGKVTVPEGITTLGPEAFGRTNVTTVHLPRTLKTIRRQCFWGCSNLEEITIPASVEFLDYAMEEDGNYMYQIQIFAYDTALKKINVEEGNEYYTSIDGVLYTKDESVLLYFPMGKNVDEPYVIPEGTKEIRYYAFDGARISSVTLPSSLTYLHGETFAENPSLTEILVAEDNPILQEYNGAVYQEDKLISYPNGKTDPFLDAQDFLPGVKTIGRWAFMDDCNIKEVELPEGITDIEWGSFIFSKSLESVTLPSTVERIEGCAFEDCEKLKKVVILNANAEISTEKSIVARSRYAVLYGYDHSTTETYAAQMQRKFVSMGEAP